ncbi:hypothetical protein BC826DRAFT_982637, partial [Russula brevipes]
MRFLLLPVFFHRRRPRVLPPSLPNVSYPLRVHRGQKHSSRRRVSSVFDACSWTFTFSWMSVVYSPAGSTFSTQTTFLSNRIVSLHCSMSVSAFSYAVSPRHPAQIATRVPTRNRGPNSRAHHSCTPRRASRTDARYKSATRCTCPVSISTMKCA